MILLYASLHEVRYVTRGDRYCIGYRAEHLKIYETLIRYSDYVILFGCSGWLGGERRWDDLIELKRIIYIPEPVHTEEQVHQCKYLNYYLVDLESYQVSEMCKKHNVPFKSIRYIIDRGDKKVMPTGINHFWRKYQHKRMQLKFNKYMEGL